MNSRRRNKSHKVPNVKLRPAQPQGSSSYRQDSSALADELSPFSSNDISCSFIDTCPRPFAGVHLCATGVDKSPLFANAGEMGANTTSNFTDRVTHLIAQSHGSAKYMCALQRGIPIMKPSWILDCFAVWQRGDDVDFEASLEQHRLPVFSGVVLTVSGIDDIERRTDINRLLTQQEGTYVKNLERPVRVTHLLCSGDDETDKMRYAKKFNAKGEAAIHLVWEEWFWDSLRFGGRFDEADYRVDKPRPERKQAPEISATPVVTAAASQSLSADASASAAKSHANDNGEQDEEEIATARRVPAVTLQVWESLLGPRGYKRVGGQLMRTEGTFEGTQPESERPMDTGKGKGKGKGKAAEAPSQGRNASQVRAAGRMPDVEIKAHSALRTFTRSNSFAPTRAEPAPSRRPFRKVATSSLAPRAPPPQPDNGGSGNGSSAAAQVFAGMRFRARGEARSASVREAVEGCGGQWVDGQEIDDPDDVDFVLVRLVSGSKLYREEADENMRRKYRTECWLEGCLARERVCGLREHITFAPLGVEIPVMGAEGITMSPSGLDLAEDMWVKRLARALGIVHAPTFSRASTHLLCPSKQGAKFDKALEWDTPVIDLTWLEEMALTGAIPPVANHLIAGTVKDPKGKGKAKENIEMMDITNDFQHAMSVEAPTKAAPTKRPIPITRKLGPPKEDGAPETFGPPKILLHGYHAPKTATPPTSPPRSRSPTVPRSPSVPSSTAASVSMLYPDHDPDPDPDPNPPLKPTQPTEERNVPSSSTPSPMKIPPDAPSRRAILGVSDEAARALQESLASLLGKRASTEDADNAPVPARSKRPRPRSKPQTRHNSGTDEDVNMLDAGIPPPDMYDPAMVSYACDEMAMLARVGQSIEDRQEGAFVTYEDPSQRAERKKLMKLLGNFDELDDSDHGAVMGKGEEAGGRRSTRIAGF